MESRITAAELLKLEFSLQPNPNSYKENNSAQDRSITVCKNQRNQRLGRPQFWPHYFSFQSSGVTNNKQDDLRK
jgi:hypothetical protein